MEWVQYLVVALIFWFLASRLMPVKGLRNLSAEEVVELLKRPAEHIFLDVREKHEYRQGHIRGFKNVPLSELKNRLGEIDPEKTVILACRSGMRSMQAAKILKKHGFTRIGHLKHGIMGWHKGLTE